MQPTEPSEPSEPPQVPPSDLVDHRGLAASLFNGVWELMERENRSAVEDDRMLHMAHASRYHWDRVGTAAHLARGEWLCSRVYAVLGRAEPCLHHANRALDLCRTEGIGDWDLAFAFEAVARAHGVAGDLRDAHEATRLALSAAGAIQDDEDRALVMADLATIPGQQRFW
jgi:hypothetical protein